MNDPGQPSEATSDDKQLSDAALLQPALSPPASKPDARNGVPLLITGGEAAPVTPELVNRLRDELP